MKYFFLLLLLFSSGKLLAEDKIIPLGSVNVIHQCYDSKSLDTALQRSSEKLRLQMVGQKANTLLEIWYDEGGEKWTALVKTRMPNGQDVSCIAAAATKGAILRTYDVIERHLH